MNPKLVYPDPTPTSHEARLAEMRVVARVFESERDALAARLAEAVKALHEIAHDDGDNALRLKFMAADALIAHNTADSADDDPYRRAAQQSLDAEREGLARARADGTAERAVDDLLKILGK
jgi:hypothetical protein